MSFSRHLAGGGEPGLVPDLQIAAHADEADGLVHARLLAEAHGQKHAALRVQLLAGKGKGLDEAHIGHAARVAVRNALEFLADLFPFFHGIEGDGVELVVEADGEALAKRLAVSRGNGHAALRVNRMRVIARKFARGHGFTPLIVHRLPHILPQNGIHATFCH